MLRFRPARLAALVLAVLAPMGPVRAQVLQPRPIPNYDVEAYTFQSPSMGVRFSIQVGLPPGYKAGAAGRKYQALIVSDGDYTFPSTLDAARSLAGEGAIDSIFVVSIGVARDEGEEEWTRRRIYEFSPPGWDRQDIFGQGVTSYCQRFNSLPDRCTGGAPRFLTVITDELVPMLLRKYAIDPDGLGLAGVSAGGFFTVWAMFQPRVPFRKYIISSPAMAYGNGEAFRLEDRYAQANKDFPVSLYMAAGALELEDPGLEGVGQIVSGMVRLAARLRGRNYPGLRLTTEVHPGMSHTDVFGTVMVRGMRTVFARTPAPAAK